MHPTEADLSPDERRRGVAALLGALKWFGLPIAKGRFDCAEGTLYAWTVSAGRGELRTTERRGICERLTSSDSVSWGCAWGRWSDYALRRTGGRRGSPMKKCAVIWRRWI